ncbi:MAG: ABC transporter ATP-binding protein [Betaproteobacteria bacterium RIFCSPLOWO2_12_FULL_66_14]|nr:MAG: ABC transporter ATP-binding protein [Betaproteobacteria bacterium RIFCSPLOWO2_12_FULL_66_14]
MLVLENVWAGYDDAAAVLKGVSFRVDPLEIVAMLGVNGAGKSTLLRVISGLLPARRGSISFEGRSIAGVPPHRRTALGLVQVPEGRQILSSMTVEENLLLGGYLQRRDKAALERAAAQVYELFPILRERRRQLGGSLSGGEQQMLAIGRALMAKPRLLLLDEPSLGLAPLVVKHIFQVIALLRDQGISILLVEQNAKKAIELADRGLILRNGEVVLTGAGIELWASEEVKSAYLGTVPSGILISPKPPPL